MQLGQIILFKIINHLTKIGSDAIDNSFGINYYNRRDLIFQSIVGYLNMEENIVNRAYEPYEDYQKGEFLAEARITII